MENFIPGTEIVIGKWYRADIPPPNLYQNDREDQYTLLLGIKSIGIQSGFYVHDEQQYYWHCERYDSFDDEPMPGWTREQEINNNLDWVYEKARGVAAWMLVPDFNEEWESVDGTDGFDHDPDQDWSVREDDDDDIDPNDSEIPTDPGKILPIHPN